MHWPSTTSGRWSDIRLQAGISITPLWENGQIIDLQPELVPNLPNTYYQATGINDNGWIAAIANGAVSAYLLTPINTSFKPVSNASMGTHYNSNLLTVSGLTGSNNVIGVNGGKYSLNGAPFTKSSATVNNGDTVRVEQTSSNALDTQTTTILFLGTQTDIFNVTTEKKTAQ